VATTLGLRAPEVPRAQVAAAEVWAPGALQEAPKQRLQPPVAAWCSDEAGVAPAVW